MLPLNVSKPKPWNARRHLVHPDWRWAWDGLVGHWIMWEGGGNLARDISGQGNHGTLTGMANDDWVLGENGPYALDFDGTDDYINIGANVITSADFSISAWIYPRSLGLTTGRGVYYHGTGLSDIGTVFGHWQTGRAFFRYEDGPIRDSPDNTLTLNAWQHLAVTHKSDGTGILYANGINVSSWSGDPITVPDTDTEYIGFWYVFTNASSSFNGFIDDVRIYNRAIPEWQTRKLYQNPFAPIVPWRPSPIVEAAAPPVGAVRRRLLLNVGA